MNNPITFNIPASPEDVEVFADSLKPVYLHCRVWGHDPQPHNVRLAKNLEGSSEAYWDVDLTCGHGCGVRWTVLAGKDGSLVKRTLSYKEAPGYISDVGRINKDGKKILRRSFLVGASKRKKKVR